MILRLICSLLLSCATIINIVNLSKTETRLERFFYLMFSALYLILTCQSVIRLMEVA